MNARPKIAILWHPRNWTFMRKKYLIVQHAALWEQDCMEVRHFRSGKAAVAWADVVIVHMDVSVIDPRLTEALALHPLVLNRGILDIRKATVSDCLLKRDSDWTGPVVVKTNLNREGRPERIKLLSAGFKGKWWSQRESHYLQFDRLKDVPDSIWANSNWVVERQEFQLSREGYSTTSATFFGDEVSAVTLTSRSSIVKGANAIHWKRLDEIPEEIMRKREHLRLDYGKIDFTVNDRGAHAFDVNKTIGHIQLHDDRAGQGKRLTAERLRERGLVIHRYLSGEIRPFGY